MRSHAKASTAGSTQRQAKGLGRIFRGVFATRDASHRAKGSGAPRARRLVLPAAVLVLALALAAIPASALKFHAFKETFGSAAQPTVNAWALGIDQSSGDVLVMDATGGTFTVKRFNPDGTPHNFSALGTNVIDGQGGPDTTPQNGLSFTSSAESQVAVDNSGTATNGDIYVTQGSPNLINIFSSTGAYLGQLTAAGATNFTEACGVAVDSTGAVYVGDYTGGIRKFVPSANPVVNTDNTATFTTTTQPCALAAGAGPTAGFLFPATRLGAISKIDSSSGELKYTVASGSHTTVAVNPGTGHVYGLIGEAIDEFDASGAGGPVAVSNSPKSGAPQGLAVRGSSGDIFYSVSISTSNKVQVLSSAISTSPDVTTTAATGLAATGATLNGTVNPDGVALSECKFEYGKTTAYGQSVPCAESLGAIGSGSSPVAVHANVSGLDPNGVQYNFRLVAKNAATPAVNGSNQSFLTLGPVILGTWAEDVGVTEAVLKAEINPKGSATTYRFEYGPSEAYGSESEELNVGSDSSVHKVLLALKELQPGTEYHYRVIATNAISTNVGPDRAIRTFRPFSAETDCPNQANRYGAGANLPDCRAYEMVSPLDKNNGDITSLQDGDSAGGIALASRTQSTPSGDKFTYGSYRAFADAQSVPWVSQYIAQRGAGGWQTHSINPPGGRPLLGGAFAVRAQYQVFSDDLCHATMRDFFESPSLEGVAGLVNVYRFDDRLCGPERFEALAPIVTPLATGPNANYDIEGASADGSHTIFNAFLKLVPAGNQNFSQLYESAEPGAPPRLVCVLPGGAAWSGACVLGSGESGPREGIRTGAISEDGERIFWTDNNGRIEGKIYLRVGGTETLPVSQAGEAIAGTTNSYFWGAATDGSRAVYTTGGQPTGSPPTSSARLFAFDVEGEATEAIAEDVYGVLGVSKDARRVYFLSDKVLPDSGQNSEGAEAIAGRPNLYYYDADAGGGTSTFIGTLSGEDAGAGAYGGFTPIDREPFAHLARVTPDGLHLAFDSRASLTGYDNKSLTNGQLNLLAYVYDAQSDELVCASCNPSGARGQSESASDSKIIRILPIPGFGTSLQPSRMLSDDGSRLFFESANALDPRDSNGKVDVYEWEKEGAGSCDVSDPRFAPSADGCIELISSGTSDFDAEFGEASASGDDVFFFTKSSLVPSDYGLRDVYDARVGGGFPLPPEAPECVGDACQSVPSAPNDPTPASAGFRGAGNPAPRKANRRCRARNRHAGKRAKRQQKHKGAKSCKRAKRRAGR